MSAQMTLWSRDDVASWSTALARYAHGVRGRGASRLVELDAWYQGALPATLAARAPAYVTAEELSRVTEWKMKRGKYRARNLTLVRGNAEADVRLRSEAAFAAIPDPRRPIVELASLAGVGPATASAVLAALRPDVYPFFDEVIAAQIPRLGDVAFTTPYYLRYAEQLRARAAALGPSWTAHAVGQALWAAAAHRANGAS
jgi:hypothetical protein